MKKLAILILVTLLNFTVMSKMTGQPIAKPELPKEKETTLGLYVTATEAYEMWKSSPDKIKILDVRTPDEYIFIGHAAMAWNVPIALQTYEWDADKKQFKMNPNPDFLDGVKAIAGPTETLMVMCRSGGRSAMAVNALAKAGYTNVYNITDGMEGDVVKDPGSANVGKRVVNGWKNSGLPWTYSIDPELMQLPGEIIK
jgi:rhodanese-related sulfurtransferase